MFDIRKIQEEVVYNAVKEVSDDETARKIVYGNNDAESSPENDSAWVKNTMLRLGNHFD